MMEANGSAEEAVNNLCLHCIAKCAVFAHSCANTAHLGKYSTLFPVNMEIKVHFPFDLAHTKYNNVHY